MADEGSDFDWDESDFERASFYVHEYILKKKGLPLSNLSDDDDDDNDDDDDDDDDDDESDEDQDVPHVSGSDSSASDVDSEASEKFVRDPLNATEIFFRDNLFAAVNQGDLASVAQLLDAYCGNEEIPDNFTSGPYPMISINGSIEERSDTNYTCPRRYTALHHAAKCGYEHIVRELVARGAAIDILDEVSIFKSSVVVDFNCLSL